MNATIINLLLKAKQILMCDEKKFERNKKRNSKLNGTERQRQRQRNEMQRKKIATFKSRRKKTKASPARDIFTSIKSH